MTPSNTALATLSSDALTAKAAGSLTVQAAYVEATPAGNSPAAATVTPQTLSASTQITITAAGSSNVPAITWNTPAAITYGTALSSTQLSATANVPGTFVYTPAADTVLKAGKQTLSCGLHPDRHQDLFCRDSVGAAHRQPGHPDHHLGCAGRDLRGHRPERHTIGRHRKCARHFHVQPGRGRRSTAGTQQLTAVFSPTDATDYASATAHASLAVGSPTSGTGPSSPVNPGIPVGTAPDGSRRSHHQPEQRHESEHTAEHIEQCSELRPGGVCGRYLQPQQLVEYSLLVKTDAHRTSCLAGDRDHLRHFC